MRVKGNLLNVFTEEIYPAEVEVQDGIIKCVKPVKEDLNNLILPGFIDAHIHIESSMLTPSRFAEAVVPHGTTSVVSDPHEIANVMGLEGIEYMINDAATVPLKIFFTAPSCVPATPFETSGSIIGPEEIERLLKRDEIVALGEMMNFPGVLNKDLAVMKKIAAAKRVGKPVDGHAPLLSGEELCKYVSAGISTEHECSNVTEALEKKSLGMKIMLREGSSARNLKDLASVSGDFIVSDDKHPEDLLTGHVNEMLKKAIDYGIDPIKALKMVTVNPAEHYNLKTGSLTPGKAADIVLVDDIEKLNIKKVLINGNLVSENGKPLFNVQTCKIKNTFNLNPKEPSDFDITLSQLSKCSNTKANKIFNETPDRTCTVRVIEAVEGQLLTLESEARLRVENGILKPDILKDVLKIAVVERYGHHRISNAFVHGFGLKEGAIASSVAHDSHNIVVVGTESQDMAHTVNSILKHGGGLAAAVRGNCTTLKLPVAGLMSTETASEVSSGLSSLQNLVKAMGCEMKSPFMALSFMALLVIPHLKISDMGLFDADKFDFVDVVKG